MRKTKTTICRPGWLRLHILPVLVWLVAVACVVVLFHFRTQRFEVAGIAQGRIHQVAATSTGRVKALSVELFEKVTRGQTLVIMDTVLDNENIQAELSVVLAEIQRLSAELVSTRERLAAEAAEREADNTVSKRRFSVDVENIRLRILELKTTLETDRIMLGDLETEVKIVHQLLDQDAVAAYQLQKAQFRYNALAKKIETNEHLLSQAQKNLKQAQNRRDEFAGHLPQHPSAEVALDVIRKAITVQEKRTEQLLARHQPLLLKAAFDGIVSQIQHRTGEAVLRGNPILTITETEPTAIITYVGQEQLAKVTETMAVQLIKNTEPAQIAASEVVYVGPAMELMPQRLWQNPNVEQWGRPVLVKIPPGLKLIPGEMVGIRGL